MRDAADDVIELLSAIEDFASKGARNARARVESYRRGVATKSELATSLNCAAGTLTTIEYMAKTNGAEAGLRIKAAIKVLKRLICSTPSTENSPEQAT